MSYLCMNMGTSLKSKEVDRKGNWKITILKLSDKCSNEPDINKKINCDSQERWKSSCSPDLVCSRKR
jgi:hypothetical protein